MSRVLNNFCVLLYKCAGAFILGAGRGRDERQRVSGRAPPVGPPGIWMYAISPYTKSSSCFSRDSIDFNGCRSPRIRPPSGLRRDWRANFVLMSASVDDCAASRRRRRIWIIEKDREYDEWNGCGQTVRLPALHIGGGYPACGNPSSRTSSSDKSGARLHFLRRHPDRRSSGLAGGGAFCRSRRL